MIRAVFFDWGNTLMAWEFDHALFVEGHLRGLAALEEPVPSQPDFTAAYAERLLPRLLDDSEEEIDYAAEIGMLLDSFGVTADDAAVLAFLAAEQRVWRPAHVLEPDVVAMLDGIRARGLKVGLVSNLFDPPVLMRELFRELGLLERLDAIALSAEVGKRKPHASLFESALAQVGVAPRPSRDGRRPAAGGRRRGAGGRSCHAPGALVRAGRRGRAAVSRRARCDRRGARRRPFVARRECRGGWHNLKTAVLSSLAEHRDLLQRSGR